MWDIDPEAGPIFQQIVKGVEQMIASGQMKPGDKLPSTRDLASEIKVNPNTVMRAFAELEVQGISETRRGLGTFVREDVQVGALRYSALVTAATRFMSDVKLLGLTLGDAKSVLEEVDRAGNS